VDTLTEVALFLNITPTVPITLASLTDQFQKHVFMVVDEFQTAFSEEYIPVRQEAAKLSGSSYDTLYLTGSASSLLSMAFNTGDPYHLNNSKFRGRRYLPLVTDEKAFREVARQVKAIKHTDVDIKTSGGILRQMISHQDESQDSQNRLDTLLNTVNTAMLAWIALYTHQSKPFNIFKQKLIRVRGLI